MTELQILMSHKLTKGPTSPCFLLFARQLVIDQFPYSGNLSAIYVIYYRYRKFAWLPLQVIYRYIEEAKGGVSPQVRNGAPRFSYTCHFSGTNSLFFSLLDRYSRSVSSDLTANSRSPLRAEATRVYRSGAISSKCTSTSCGRV